MRRVLLLCSLVTILGFNPVRAEWLPDGTLIGGAGTAYSGAMVPDGSGGAIIIWGEIQNGSYDVLARRVDADGTPLWAAGGVPVCAAAGEQTDIAAISDGAGGAIIAWRDARSGTEDIYAQRVNSTGATTWTANGVAICVAAGLQVIPRLASDGASGAIIVWQDGRSLTNWDIYARRVTFSGSPQWAADGVAVCTLTSGQSGPVPVEDGSGGIIVGWSDVRNGNGDLFAQRLNAAGAPQWLANGVSVCSAVGNQGSFSMVLDGSGGAYFVWDDERSGARDIFAQRINGSGAPVWDVDGKGVCEATNDQAAPRAIGDGAGGMIAAWDDLRNGINTDIYAQRMNASGVPLWTYTGVALCMAADYQYTATLVPDGASGAIAAWSDTRSGTEFDVYARRVDAGGLAMWDYDGARVSTASYDQTSVLAVGDGAGGAIVGWTDTRSGVAMIYAQRTEPRYGYWGRPEPAIKSAVDNPSDQGGRVIVRWAASQRDLYRMPAISHYSIWRATDFAAFRAVIDAGVKSATRDPRSVAWDHAGSAVWEQETAAGPVYWEWVANLEATYQPGYSYTAPTRQDSTVTDPATTYFKVLAHEVDYPQGRVWESSTASARSVDNLAPASPLLLTIQQSGSNAVLNWKPVGDLDLAHYTLYRAGASGVQIIPINELTSATLPNYTDVGAAPGLFHYVVTAIDTHGNQSAPSNEVSLQGSTGVGDTPAITALTLQPNSPNPFAVRTEITVGVPADGAATVELFDIAGRRVLQRDLGRLEKGWQKVVIEAVGAGGEAMASGVYFCRVSMNGQHATRKLVIAR